MKKAFEILFILIVLCVLIGTKCGRNEKSNSLIDLIDVNDNNFNSVIPSNEEILHKDFRQLPLRKGKITVSSLLADLYNRDSCSIISDFDVYLNPNLYYYTPLDNIPIEDKCDTIYIQSEYVFGDYIGSSIVKVWNKKMAVSAVVKNSYFYKNILVMPDWEQRLIESWNVDSLLILQKPTFYDHWSSNYESYYTFQIIIENRKAKSRYMTYNYLNDYPQ